MLDQGRIVAIGTPDEVAASDNAWVQRFLGFGREHIGRASGSLRAISSDKSGTRTSSAHQ